MTGTTTGAYAPALARDAARAIWLHVRQHGLRTDRWGHSVLPAGCGALPPVAALGERVTAPYRQFHRDLRDTEPDPVQLLLRLPDQDTEDARGQYTPHVDRTPEGGTYRLVIGCSLTEALGGTVIADGCVFGFHAGDAWAWLGGVRHQGIPNLTDTPRLTAYWRFR